MTAPRHRLPSERSLGYYATREEARAAHAAAVKAHLGETYLKGHACYHE
jgi:hypothetical protein